MTAVQPRADLAGTAFHPRLAAAFRAMETAPLRWALLRLPDRPHSPTGDVDLLVHPDDAGLMAPILQPLGFTAVPGRAAAPEVVFVSYDRASATWFTLDVSTELSFGRDLRFRVAPAAAVLARSRTAAGARVLASDDGFWALMLHCLLEKDTIADRHRSSLRALAAQADPHGPLASTVADACPPGWDPGRVVSAAVAGQWHDLEELRDPLRRGWVRAHQGGLRRARRLRLRRVLRGPLTAFERRGVSAVLLGSNGAGKSTVAARVIAAYPGPAHLCYLGLWKETRPAGRARTVMRVVARPAVVWTRYATSLAHRAAGGLVVFDRYTYDALLPPRPPLVLLKRPYLWVLAHSCPAPTVTVVLDVPAEVAWERKGENPVEELEQERRHLLGLRDRLRRVHVVDATRPVDEVAADVTALVWDCYATRWRNARS
jgi:thymidylate kinase